MNKTELDVILEKHKKWLMGEEGGEKKLHVDLIL